MPIVGGGRVTGKAGAFDVGALNIQTDDDVISGAETTNFTVVRVKRDILRRSSIGALFTNRSVSVVGDGSNQAYGADATFSFYDNVSLLAYIARTETPGLGAEDMSYQGQFTYAGDRYGFQAEHLVVEDNFVARGGIRPTRQLPALVRYRAISVLGRDRSKLFDSSGLREVSTTS